MFQMRQDIMSRSKTASADVVSRAQFRGMDKKSANFYTSLLKHFIIFACYVRP